MEGGREGGREGDRDGGREGGRVSECGSGRVRVSECVECKPVPHREGGVEEVHVALLLLGALLWRAAADLQAPRLVVQAVGARHQLAERLGGREPRLHVAAPVEIESKV
jgi:hypothetical protein